MSKRKGQLASEKHNTKSHTDPELSKRKEVCKVQKTM